MKATAAILLFASALNVHGFADCDSETISAKIGPALDDASVKPCVEEVGAICFRPTKNESAVCAGKFEVSKACPASWPTIAKAFASIDPICQYGSKTSAELGQGSWKEFLVVLDYDNSSSSTSGESGSPSSSTTPTPDVPASSSASAIVISAVAGVVALVTTLS
jgi:hypothetical protein